MAEGRLLVVADGAAGLDLASSIDCDDWRTDLIDLGAAALEAAQKLRQPIVILDARPADHCHTLFCQTFRGLSELGSIPLFALTSPDSHDGRHRLLDAGADDCWSEPVGSQAFALRLKTIHQRLYPSRSDGLLRCGGIELDVDRYRVRVEGAPIQLTATQMMVLKHLMERPGLAVSPSELLDRVWRNPKVGEGTVITCMMRLRRVLSRAGKPEAIRRVRPTAYILG